MRSALNCAWKDVRLLLRDPVALLAWIGVPVLITLLMALVFGRSDVRPQGRLLVADEDDTFLSSLIPGAFSRGDLSKMITVEKVEQSAGRARLDKGEASALLIIPKGFSEAFLAAKPAELRLITNPAQTIMPAIIKEVLSILIEGGHYLQLIAGEELLIFSKGPPAGQRTFPDAEIAAISQRINRIGASVAEYLDPPPFELKTTTIEEPSRPRRNFIQIMFPGMLMTSVLFVSLGLATAIWDERNGGLLRRFATAPAGLGSFLVGKFLGAACVFLLVAAAGLGAGQLILNLQGNNLALAILWLGAAGVTLYSVLQTVVLYATSDRAAQILGNLLVLPLSMIGGGFFPFEILPPVLAAIGRRTPNGWALAELRTMLEGSPGGASLALALAGLATITIVAFILSLRRIRKAFLY